MPDVLRREEYLEGETIQEVSRRQQTSHRAKLKASAALHTRTNITMNTKYYYYHTHTHHEKVGDVLDLRNGVNAVAAVLFHQMNRIAVLCACEAIVHLLHVSVYLPPDTNTRDVKSIHSMRDKDDEDA